MTEAPQEPPVVSDAWGALWALACGEHGERRDWDGFTVRAAMRDADARGVPYLTVRATMLRLAGDLDAGTREVVAELGHLNRAPSHRGCGNGIPAEVREALVARMNEETRRLMGATSAVPPQRAAGDNESTETD